MKAIMSALGKSLFTVMLVASLVSASCNSNRSRDRVRDNNNSGMGSTERIDTSAVDHNTMNRDTSNYSDTSGNR